ncbi:DUF3987 domain-containing protein [Leptodesmis sichuanensis]|uniref:DUF3987 domain-containing protein n=1 Tax=Leptodesmis sichuanensis TaxID=2906798 RepID=UPI001F337CE6|nr:DUF3987 domain-containing protein [Leptodesmis sichuanensis]UIE35997.1 DUF3987 domain-containing protein [Leptodesmis sichuanensis A121]
MVKKINSDRGVDSRDRFTESNSSTYHSTSEVFKPQVDTKQAIAHLKLLGYQPGNPVFLRFFYDKNDPRKADDKGRKANGAFPALSWQKVEAYQGDKRGIYFVVNGGGHCDADVQAGRAFFYEHDNLSKELSASLWRELGLPEPTFQVDTGGKSIHSYWVLIEPCTVEDWKIFQADLLEFADADRNLKNPSRVMRLAGCLHPATNQKATIISNSGKCYSFEELRAVVPSAQKAVPITAVPPARDTDREIERALAVIPRRIANTGTYPMYRNVLWAVKSRYGTERAIALMEHHSPSKECGWDIAQVCRSGGKNITLGSLFYYAKQYGFEFEETAKMRESQQPQEKFHLISEESDDDDPVTLEGIRAILAESSSRPDLAFIHPSLMQPLQQRARLLNIPLECFIGAILPVAASLLKVKTNLCLSAATNWYAPPILWTALVGESGTAKSPVWETAIAPLNTLQTQQDHQYEAASRDYEEALVEWEKRDKEQRGKKPQKPVPRELYFQDATLEAIALAISHYPEHGTLYAVDELTQFSKGFDAYRNGRGGDRAKWLTAYDGQGLKVNRKGATRISMARSAISLSGGIQPEILQREMGNLQVIDGFWQRIAYFPIPLTKAPIPREGETCNLSEILESAYQCLDAFPAQTFYLDSEANKSWKQWFAECENLKVKELHPAIRALYPKAKERAARIALVIHCLNAAIEGTNPPEKIPAKTLQGAIDLTRWTLTHTRLLFADFGQGENPQAVKLVRFVERFRGMGWIAARDVMRWYSRRQMDAKDARVFMMQVVNFGYAVTNGEEPDSKKFRIQIVPDTPDKSLQDLSLQRIEAPDKRERVTFLREKWGK